VGEEGDGQYGTTGTVTAKNRTMVEITWSDGKKEWLNGQSADDRQRGWNIERMRSDLEEELDRIACALVLSGGAGQVALHRGWTGAIEECDKEVAGLKRELLDLFQRK
jgi:hypothetical protein